MGRQRSTTAGQTGGRGEGGGIEAILQGQMRIYLKDYGLEKEPWRVQPRKSGAASTEAGVINITAKVQGSATVLQRCRWPKAQDLGGARITGCSTKPTSDHLRGERGPCVSPSCRLEATAAATLRPPHLFHTFPTYLAVVVGLVRVRVPPEQALAVMCHQQHL